MQQNLSFDFDGKTAVITGSRGGLGSATARLFHESGANLVLTDAFYSSESGQDPADGLPKESDRIIRLAGDAARSSDMAEAAETAVNAFGGLDFLLTFAGVLRNQPAVEMSDDDWRRTMSINLDGTFFAAREALRHMNTGGAVVTISSMAGHRGARRNVSYGASKAGVIGVTRSLSWEAAARGIRVNGISPGLIETAMGQKSGSGGRAQEVIQETPLARQGMPEEIASVAAFLCSTGASFMSGEMVQVNGGYHMAG